MRLIDADSLRDRLQNLAYDDWNQGVSISFADAYREIADIVEDMPTIEPELNIEDIKEYCYERGLSIINNEYYKYLFKGKWLRHPAYKQNDYREWDVCSVCGVGCRRRRYGENPDGTEYVTIYGYKYCPNCGADMRGEEE